MHYALQLMGAESALQRSTVSKRTTHRSCMKVCSCNLYPPAHNCMKSKKKMGHKQWQQLAGHYQVPAALKLPECCCWSSRRQDTAGFAPAAPSGTWRPHPPTAGRQVMRCVCGGWVGGWGGRAWQNSTRSMLADNNNPAHRAVHQGLMARPPSRHQQ